MKIKCPEYRLREFLDFLKTNDDMNELTRMPNFEDMRGRYPELSDKALDETYEWVLGQCWDKLTIIHDRPKIVHQNCYQIKKLLGNHVKKCKSCWGFYRDYLSSSANDLPQTMAGFFEGIKRNDLLNLVKYESTQGVLTNVAREVLSSARQGQFYAPGVGKKNVLQTLEQMEREGLISSPIKKRAIHLGKISLSEIVLDAIARGHGDELSESGRSFTDEVIDLVLGGYVHGEEVAEATNEAFERKMAYLLGQNDFA